MALRAMALSKDRAGEIRKLLVEKFGIDAKRIETVGRGWEETAGPNSDLNRRVEVQWFTSSESVRQLAVELGTSVRNRRMHD